MEMTHERQRQTLKYIVCRVHSALRTQSAINFHCKIYYKIDVYGVISVHLRKIKIRSKVQLKFGNFFFVPAEDFAHCVDTKIALNANFRHSVCCTLEMPKFNCLSLIGSSIHKFIW